ncbi:MAG: peptidylprolyl isomerase [Alphaproteobacteria bacterium]|nr:peptidylprolyl isomerase [Alphaproteobacteria bacterium]
MFKKISFYTVAFVSIVSFVNAGSQSSSDNTAKIAIVVNKDVITAQDIADRISLVLLTSGMENTPQNRDSITPQIRKSLVDERIQLQTAKEQKIIVADVEIQNALENISKDNNMTAAQMTEMFKQRGVPIKTLEDRLRAQIAWSRAIRDAFTGMVHVTEADIDDALNKAQQDKDKDQYEVLEIFLRLDQANQENSVLKETRKIYDQLKNGASFRVMARQFSQSTSSINGGYIGWLVKGKIDPAIQTAVEKLAVGTFSEPVRVGMGYKIVFLKDHRKAGAASYGETKISYRQVYIPVSDPITEETQQRVEAHIQELHKISNCEKLSAKAKEFGYRCEVSPKAPLNAMPEGLQALFHTVKPGQCLKPIRTEDHMLVTMVCSREEAAVKLPTRLEIKDMLEQEKFSKLANREFNKLRSVAFIDEKGIGQSAVPATPLKKTQIVGPKDAIKGVAAAG